uniref:BRMS1 transcriptional repressor and anoikis regulator n=1 Tax=Sander lucioperca TaxID=283035 RepID=A0A8D0AXE2_SANLU
MKEEAEEERRPWRRARRRGIATWRIVKRRRKKRRVQVKSKCSAKLLPDCMQCHWLFLNCFCLSVLCEEMDDEDCERRRGECLDEMLDLEKQFQELKEKLFRERQNQVKVKLDEVLTGKAGEYREPLVLLQESMHIRTQVAGVYRELCLQVIKHKYECEQQGAKQHLESERMLLFDAMKTELLEKIRRLEEDRQNVDLTSEWSDEMGKKCKRKNLLGRSERKKKVALVSGPFIVYMLRDIDILEDWSAIKKAKAALSPLKKKVEKR